MIARPGRIDDAAAIARIYSEGIEERTATFETQPRTEADVRPWFAGSHPVAVAELSIYVARDFRGRGAGRAALEQLLRSAEAEGFWKLLGGVLSGNAASLRLLRAAGFREVGVYRKHARLDGAWRDVVLLERLLGEAARAAADDEAARPADLNSGAASPAPPRRG